MGFGDWFGGLSDYASKLFSGGESAYQAPEFYGSDGGGAVAGINPDANIGNIPEVSMSWPSIGEAPTGIGASPAGAASSGGGDIWNSIRGGIKDFGGFAKDISPLLGLGSQVLGGVAAFQAANQSGKASDRADQAAARQAEAQKAQMAAAEPLTTFGKSELEQATAGNIGPAAQARIQNWIQGARQQVNDFLARSGQGNSSALAMWESWIQQQAKEMEAAELQRMKAGGIQATTAGGQILGSASAGAGQAASGAAQDEQAINGLIAAANQQLARLSSGAAA